MKKFRPALDQLEGRALLSGVKAPIISFVAPLNGATVSGPVQVQATATKGKSISYAVDNTPATGSWDTTTVPNGMHTITATALNKKGNPIATATETVNVSNIKQADLSVSVNGDTINVVNLGPTQVDQFIMTGHIVNPHDVSGNFDGLVWTVPLAPGQRASMKVDPEQVVAYVNTIGKVTDVNPFNNLAVSNQVQATDLGVSISNDTIDVVNNEPLTIDSFKLTGNITNPHANTGTFADGIWTVTLAPGQHATMTVDPGLIVAHVSPTGKIVDGNSANDLAFSNPTADASLFITPSGPLSRDIHVNTDGLDHVNLQALATDEFGNRFNTGMTFVPSEGTYDRTTGEWTGLTSKNVVMKVTFGPDPNINPFLKHVELSASVFPDGRIELLPLDNVAVSTLS